MSLEFSLKEISNGLSSNRATERKKSAESLKDCLMRNAVPILLSENTKKKCGYTWNNLFDDINDYVLKECEKYETSKNFETVTGPLSSSLLYFCLAGANKGKAHIKCEKITEACLYILRDNNLRKAMGDSYSSLLYKYILNCDYYISNITPTSWENLLEVSITMCLSNHSKLDNFTKYKILWLILKNGANSCQLVVPVRDLLPKINKCLLKVMEEKKVQEVIVEILTVLLELLFAECRHTLCEFFEGIFSSILKIYEPNLELKKKITLFKLLVMIVNIHHPKGRLQSTEGSLAHNLSVWNKHLNNILEVICIEISFLQKLRKQNDLLIHQCEHFYTLAAAVHYQVFNIQQDTRSDNEETLNSSKRQRLQYNKNKSFLDLLDELQQNPIPWLGIVNKYVKNYIDTISESDYLYMFNVTGGLITNTNNVNWDLFEELVCFIINNISPTFKEEYEDAITSIWNSCVRNCTLLSASHKALQSIMQCIIMSDSISHDYVKPLLKIYFERGMPVGEYSLLTLSTIISRFFNRLSSFDERILLFNWLTFGNFKTINPTFVNNFLLQILSNERIQFNDNITDKRDNLYGTLFHHNDKCILFSEFQSYEIEPEIDIKETEITVHINGKMESQMTNYFLTLVLDYSNQSDSEISLKELINTVNIILGYFNILLKHHHTVHEDLEATELYLAIFQVFKRIFESVAKLLQGKKYLVERIVILKGLRDIFCKNYDQLICFDIRKSIPDEFFHCLHKILNSESVIDEDVVIDEDEVNNNELKHNCIWLIAAYCRKKGNYRNQLLDLILSNDSYDFTSRWDIECSFQTINILSDMTEDTPIDKIFLLLQGMCKDLFKNSEASIGILKVLINMLEDIWDKDDNMRQNCFIMIKGYLQMCEKSYYPPQLAGLVYECVAKISALNYTKNRDLDYTFKEALLDKMKGDIHRIRLYCCYLLQPIIEHLNDSDIENFMTELLNIFVVNMSARNEEVVKDEILNRTLTLLHNFYALAKTKKHMIHKIVLSIIQVQKEKSLNKSLVQKVLNRITCEGVKKPIKWYLKDNILMVLHFWFTNKNKMDDFPFYLFGEDSLCNFLVSHMNWCIPADILWNKEGEVSNSGVLNLIKNKSEKSEESLIEACFCNIIALCLPLIVIEKYGISHTETGSSNVEQSVRNATKMLQSTRQILDIKKWSNSFVDKMAELVMMSAKHLRDARATNIMFQLNILNHNEAHFYPKTVFLGILKYFGELIEGNIMQFLTEDQPIAIYKILFELWDSVLKANIFEFKVMNLCTYLAFLDNIPMESTSDTFICNFVCRNLAYAIKDSEKENEIRVFATALKSTLLKFLPDKVIELKQCLPEIMSVLTLKKGESNDSTCIALLDYIDEHWKDCFNDVSNTSEDVIDFAGLMSQYSRSTLALCSTKLQFIETFKTYTIRLLNPSHETLLKLLQFLKCNKEYVRNMCDDLQFNGFSELCKTSTIHQVVNLLTKIMKSSLDSKMKIEACNCLAEIGTFDLKTLMTVAPATTWKVLDVEPKMVLAIEVAKSLQDIMFDDDPVVTSKVVNCLNILLRYREGEYIFASGDVNTNILKPLSVSTTESCSFKIDSVKFNSYRIKTFWLPQKLESHNDWLVRLTTTILEILASPTNYLSALEPVCQIKPNICQKIISHLTGMIIICLPEKYIYMIEEQINEFFRHVWDLTFDTVTGSSGDRKVCTVNYELKLIIHSVLDVINFVRLQKKYYKRRSDRALGTLNYLNLHYDKVAWAATVADQHLTALYYGELWAVLQNDGVPPVSPDKTSQLQGGENLQQIFRKCYVSMGEMDAINGCGTAHLTIEEEKRKHLINVGEFTDALLLHDIALSCSGGNQSDLQFGVIKSLHKSGMHHLALQYINSIPETDKLNDIKYECLSFLGDWSVLVDTRDLDEESKTIKNTSESMIKAFRYSCLKDCLNLQNCPEFDKKLELPLNRAKLAVSKFCENLNMKNCQSVYKVVEKLTLFKDIEDYFSVRNEKTSISELLNQWRVEKLPLYCDFKYLEPMLSQRSLFLEHAAKHNVEIAKDITSLQLEYAELCLSHKNIQMAQRLVATVKKNQLVKEVSLLESQISWAKGHKDIALSLLRNTVKNLTPDDKFTAVSLRQYGLWMAESKRDNVKDIIDKYLKKSLEVLKKSDHVDTRLKVYYDIAKFADSEYNQVVSYMESSAFENKLKCLESMKGTASQLKSTQISLLTRDEKKAILTNDRFSELDEAEIISTKAEKERFLHLAMRYYLVSLRHCEDNNLSVFRVISLWLDNPGLELNSQKGGSFQDVLHAVPSRKFITVLPQLAPRLTLENNSFANNLRELLKRCAIDHPHHTLPILFSLKNSDKDEQILNASCSISGGSRRESKEPRVVAAQALIAQLANEPKLKHIVAQMERLCDATISLANFDPKPTRESRQKIPAAETIHKLGHLDHIPIPTNNIDIRNDCDYSKIATFQSVEDYYELVGGINCPKKIFCKSSDGKRKLVLVKGKDDLRQDAVMQQVFNIVNTLLRKNTITDRNKLLIRTYKVVPMSKRSGILEWCEGTIPLGSYLTGDTGAHAQYRPQDMSFRAAREDLAIYHKNRKSNAEKLILFLRILKSFKPVFHYFFTEHYHDPVTWYERRLAYTKSVATSSMVGYILGLGDRHVQNILIDQMTAEVIHIDFGIAFDQGKALPTPETVPFRLTQDMVSGFGCSGVEGIFRKSCENTMQLLRDHQEMLLTILEVLLCDPLYSWTVVKAQQNVGNTSRNSTAQGKIDSSGSLAKRALLGVSSKLSGTEGGVAVGVAVPGQVATLIQAAADSANLSRLYPGWQPYL